ncbi:MAG: family 10 glycosylhydrolase [Victivallaceae bacterium]|nr:family 10 glycosylhydrolase [Victivallaceae bacterium]
MNIIIAAGKGMRNSFVIFWAVALSAFLGMRSYAGAEPLPAKWRFAVNVAGKDINGLVDINDMRINEHLLHYRSENQLNGLTMSLTYDVVSPATCYLTSDCGSMYWHNISLATLNQSMVFSDEKIDLSKKGKHEITVHFTRRSIRYLDKLAKGPNCIRGHHCFKIMDENGAFIGVTRNTDYLTNPEKAFLGGRVNINDFYKNTIYTLANLENYKLVISAFSSNWKKNGWFAFQIKVTDADKNSFGIYRADVEAVGRIGSKEIKLPVKADLDRYNIPRGWFVGKLETETPDEINLKIGVLAVTPRGREYQKAEKLFHKGENLQHMIPYSGAEKTFSRPDEGRVIWIHMPSALSRDPQAGMKQLTNIVQKARENNFNVIAPLMLEGRCLTSANINCKYLKRNFKKWDPCSEFRKLTRKFGLELYGVVSVITEGVEHPEGILLEHPEWATVDQHGHKKGWLDPAVPEVRQYLLGKIIMLTQKYDLDGICLDYCRLSGFPSRRGVEIYEQETGIDPAKLVQGSKEYINWYKWEGNQLTKLVRLIREELKKVKPDCKLSAYVQGIKYDGEDYYREYHQNFIEWIEKGYLDVVFPTGYVYDMLRFESWAARQIKACKKANPAVPVLITIGVKSSGGTLQSSQELIDQINILRKLHGDGAAFFTWSSLKKWIDVTGRKAYSKKAKFPYRCSY